MDNKDAYVTDQTISEDNVSFYNTYGFLIAPGLISMEEIRDLKAETAAIFRGDRGQVEGMLAVTGQESDAEILKKYVAIHFPHKISPLIYKALSHRGIVPILKAIIGADIKCMQSMLFVKGPGKAGQSWHQDEFYIPTRDMSLTGVWMAIDDASIDNGCLWIIPGRPGYIMRRVENKSDAYADVDTVDVSEYGAEVAVPIEVTSGSVVFFHGYTLHSSLKNKTTDRCRMALVNHYMNAASMLPWDQDGKLDATEDLRDIVMVSGQDPYKWKGVISVNEPYLRPEILKIKK